MEDRKQGGCLTAFLIVGIIFGLLGGLSIFTGPAMLNNPTMQQSYAKMNITPPPAWTFVVNGLLSLVNAACLAAVWKWKRWGVIGYFSVVVIALLVGLVMNTGGGPGAAMRIPIMFIGLVFPIIFFFLIRPIWNELD